MFFVVVVFVFGPVEGFSNYVVQSLFFIFQSLESTRRMLAMCEEVSRNLYIEFSSEIVQYLRNCCVDAARSTIAKCMWSEIHLMGWYTEIYHPNNAQSKMERSFHRSFLWNP